VLATAGTHDDDAPRAHGVPARSSSSSNSVCTVCGTA
jgi:hypothetical protein